MGKVHCSLIKERKKNLGTPPWKMSPCQSTWRNSFRNFRPRKKGKILCVTSLLNVFYIFLYVDSRQGNFSFSRMWHFVPGRRRISSVIKIPKQKEEREFSFNSYFLLSPIHSCWFPFMPCAGSKVGMTGISNSPDATSSWKTHKGKKFVLYIPSKKTVNLILLSFVVWGNNVRWPSNKLLYKLWREMKGGEQSEERH